MALVPRLRQFLPVVVSLAIIAAAAAILGRSLRHIVAADIFAQLARIPMPALVSGAVFVAIVYTALAVYEVLVVRQVRMPVSARRAVLAAIVATPVGHAIGWGALSGGAVRYRLYAGPGVRAIDVGKVVLLAVMPYALALGLLLGLALVLASPNAGALLRVDPAVARSAGLALIALHLGYVTLTVRRRTPLPIGNLYITLPPPRFTAIQYLIGATEVCASSAVLYVLLPQAPAATLPFAAFVAAYVLCILAGLASSVPAGLGVFESVLLLLLPRVNPAHLIGSVLAYRFLLEVVPLLTALTLFAAYEFRMRLIARRRPP